MPTRKSRATWEGDLRSGKGTMEVGNGAMKGSYSFPSRFESGTGTNPEELIGAAHAGCFSMALAHALAQAGFTPESVNTTATVMFEKKEEGFRITQIHLQTEVQVPGLDETKLTGFAEDAKRGCPISNALTGVNISVAATLASGVTPSTQH